MKSYYERNGVVLYCGDARNVLPSLERDSCDLLLTDPPYGVSYQSNFRQQKFDLIAGDENQDVALEVLRLCVPLLHNSAHSYVFGRFDLAPLSFAKQVELIWDKVALGAGDLESPWSIAHEYIQFAVRKKSMADVERGQGRLAAKIRKGSVLRHRRSQNMDLHPTEKPVPLLRELIESSSCFGDVVLDPFAGVGSTLVAARLEGRKAVGVEISEPYCEIAAGRLEKIGGLLELLV